MAAALEEEGGGGGGGGGVLALCLQIKVWSFSVLSIRKDSGSLLSS